MREVDRRRRPGKLNDFCGLCLGNCTMRRSLSLGWGRFNSCLEIQFQSSASVKAPAPPGTMFLHPGNDFLTPEFLLWTFQNLAIRNRERGQGGLLRRSRQFRLVLPSHTGAAILLVNARSGFTADWAGHPPGCELRQKLGARLGFWADFALAKLACYLARSPLLRDAAPS